MIGPKLRRLKKLKTDLHFAARDAAAAMAEGSSTTKTKKQVDAIRLEIKELEESGPELLSCVFCKGEAGGDYRALQLYHIIHPVNGSTQVLLEHLTIPACLNCSSELWAQYEEGLN